MISLRDQCGELVCLSTPATRVVSLVPSITEYLVEAGVNVVGRTKFCYHPKEKIADIPIIGGTKNFRLEVIKKLNPDLIVGNKEENYEEGILALRHNFPLYLSNIVTIDESFTMMNDLATLTNKTKDTDEIIARIKEKYVHFQGQFSAKVLYLIWQKPFMAAGKQTYIHHMLTWMGYDNVITTDRYPEFTPDELAALDVDIVMLSSEPYPFKDKDVIHLKRLLPKAEVKLVNGEFYSWYGTRILHTTPSL